MCAQSRLILSDPVDCSPPDSPVHGFSRQKYWSGLLFLPPGIFPVQGWNPGLLHWQVDAILLSQLGIPLLRYTLMLKSLQVFHCTEEHNLLNQSLINVHE